MEALKIEPVKEFKMLELISISVIFFMQHNSVIIDNELKH